MDDRRPHRHEKTIQELKVQAEVDKGNTSGVVQFPRRGNEGSPLDEIFGTEASARATVEPLAGQPNSNLKILLHEKIMLGTAIVITAILMGLLLLLLLDPLSRLDPLEQ